MLTFVFNLINETNNQYKKPQIDHAIEEELWR